MFISLMFLTCLPPTATSEKKYKVGYLILPIFANYFIEKLKKMKN